MNARSFIHCLLPLTALLLLPGCQSSKPSSSDHLRRPSWWGFYERGLQRSQQERWQAARDDLETAIGARAGAIYADPIDRRRAKTYGMHFLDDYFPNRELGVCFYYLGDYKQA